MEHFPYVREKVKNFLGPHFFFLNSKKTMKNPDIRGQIQHYKGMLRLKRDTFFSIYLLRILAFLSARVSCNKGDRRSRNELRSWSSRNIGLFSIPLPITCCKGPGESNRTTLGMEALQIYVIQYSNRKERHPIHLPP